MSSELLKKFNQVGKLVECKTRINGTFTNIIGVTHNDKTLPLCDVDDCDCEIHKKIVTAIQVHLHISTNITINYRGVSFTNHFNNYIFSSDINIK